MAFEFSKAVGLVAAITGTAKRLLDTREEVKINEIAIQLQGNVLDLQTEMMMIQSDYQNVLRSKEDLEKKLVEQENWNKERARYHLKNVGKGLTGFVYALNKSEPPIEPPHWICPNCYEDKKRSILQFTQKYPSSWICPRCKTEFFFSEFPKET